MISEQVREFVTTNFYVADPAALDSAESLLDAGVIDSTGVLELIDFVEATFGFRVADAEMIPENLDSIDAITAYVTRRTAAQAS